MMLPSLWLSLIQPKSPALSSAAQHLLFAHTDVDPGIGEVGENKSPQSGIAASLVEEELWWFSSIFFSDGEEIQGDGRNLK